MTLLVFLLMSAVGGANAALVKFTVTQFPPIILVASRAILALFVVSPFVIRLKLPKKWPNKKYLFICNLLFAANWILFAFGVQYTSVIMSQLIYVPTALIVAILGFLFLGEKLSKEQIAGLLLTLAGMSILVFGSIRTSDIKSFGTISGNLLIAAGLASWSLYLVFSRKISEFYSPLTITFLNFLISAVIGLLILTFARENFSIQNVTFAGIFGLFAIAIFSSVIFFYMYQWLIKKTSAFISSLALYLTTIFASITGIIFYGEKFTINLGIGSLLTVGGVFLATSFKYFKNR